MARYRARATASTSESAVDAPGFSNPDPRKPVNFRFEEDGTGKFFKWDRDSRADMVGGTFVLQRSETENGTFVTITGGDAIPNPASGTTVSQKDVETDNGGKWYRVKAVNLYGNSSAWTRPIKVPVDSDLCEVRIRVRKIDGTKYTGVNKPTVEFELEDLVDVYESETHNAMFTPVDKPNVKLDDEGSGCITLYRSSVMSDRDYKASLVVGNETFVTATAFTVPNSATANLMDLTEFTAST